MVADLKPEFVDVARPLTYATRLRILLRVLNELGRRRLGRGEDTFFIGPVESLRIIHNVRWTIIDEERRMSMSVVFDGAMEPYARKLRDLAGPVLDAILCHCSAYRGYLGYQAFVDFISENQVANEFFGASVHGLTIDDQIYLKELEQQQRGETNPEALDRWAAEHRLTAPDSSGGAVPPQEEIDRQAARALSALYPLDSLFPGKAAGRAMRSGKSCSVNAISFIAWCCPCC